MWILILTPIINWVAWIHIAAKYREKKYYFYGFLYFLPLIIDLIITDYMNFGLSDFPKEFIKNPYKNQLIKIYFIMYLISIFHALYIKNIIDDKIKLIIKSHYIDKTFYKSSILFFIPSLHWISWIAVAHRTKDKKYLIIPVIQLFTIINLILLTKTKYSYFSTSLFMYGYFYGLLQSTIIKYKYINNEEQTIISNKTYIINNNNKININTVSEEKLSSIIEIGPILAKKAIQYRERNGIFNTIDEFTELLKLKPYIINKIKNILIIDINDNENHLQSHKYDKRVIDY